MRDCHTDNILKKGDTFIFDNSKAIGNNKRVYLSNSKVFNSVKKGHLILIDDGNIHLKITGIKKNLIRTKVIQGGILKSKKGVNLPQSDLRTSALSSADKKYIKIAANLNVDWIALSFVQKPSDIKELRKLCDSKISIMAKIEKPSALKYINEICEIADGIMIARGDLGVELPIETVPGWQKKIIRTSRVKGKPVVVSTQMLESMTSSLTPTRAEVSDVANAVFEGTDAIMLSAETAVGKYPLESISTMSSISINVENEIAKNGNFQINEPQFKKTNVLTSICHAAYNIALDINIPIIAVMTESGSTARMVSNFRPDANIVAVCPYDKIARRLNLFWGVHTLILDQLDSVDDMISGCQTLLKNQKLIKKNQKFVFIAGVPIGMPGSTNILKVHEVE